MCLQLYIFSLIRLLLPGVLLLDLLIALVELTDTQLKSLLSHLSLGDPLILPAVDGTFDHQCLECHGLSSVGLDCNSHVELGLNDAIVLVTTPIVNIDHNISEVSLLESILPKFNLDASLSVLDHTSILAHLLFLGHVQLAVNLNRVLRNYDSAF